MYETNVSIIIITIIIIIVIIIIIIIIIIIHPAHAQQIASQVQSFFI